MQLHIINSNSTGNAYILESNREALLIECGVRYDRILAALNYKLDKVVGCIVTHEHRDHCKAIDQVLAAGINVWASKGTHVAMNTLDHHRSKVMVRNGQYTLGEFKVKPFNANHDCAEPLGFLINHAECGTVLFLTDSYYTEYTFEGLSNVIIEANYCQSIVEARMATSGIKKFLRDRVIESHMNIETCKKTLAANDLSKVQRIVLIHLSDSNSDAKRFKREVEEQTGKPVFIAEPGLIIPFNKTPF